ncbi:MAG: DNA mismatch repair endonuclease MutL, partial [Chlorobi bacterium]|nr:DNA mismatch repair endonuclease MutL [Chlorobiota bacterium]
GGDTVEIIIAGAGKNLIQVIDNGSGMSEEDVLMAFERHATSKIETVEDLQAIKTFGFRGEALSSIASIAQVELKTRREEDEVATHVRIAGGEVEEITKAQAQVGTSITVKNLFFNTPARRHFLKSNSTEFRHISDTVQKYVLAYPNIRFKFTSDGQVILDVPPGSLLERVKTLFGEKIASSLIEVEERTDTLSVSGFIGRPNYARKTRGQQFLFLNTRPIINRSINHAVFKAYEHLIDPNSEYPMYILFLNVDTRMVDVNVHPQKLEVKFSDDRHVYNLVQAVVRQGLYRHDLTPSLQFRGQPGTGERRTFGGTGTADDPDDWEFPMKEERTSHPSTGPDYRERTMLTSPRDRQEMEKSINELFQSLDETIKSSVGRTTDQGEFLVDKESRADTIPDTHMLWQLHNKYILAPIKSGLMIIDQHVAHERILYEKALHMMEHALPFSQQLLFPHSMRVVAGDYTLLEELRPDLERMGFVLKLEPPNFVTVEGVPQDVRVGMEERILEELLEQFKEYQALENTDQRDNLAASFGCRAAIKSGDQLSPAEMHMLIDQLFATKMPYVCPHGRPIVIKLSLAELDLRFGRTS